MIVDKFYDINGQPYKVQAAGTVYNEEKNSLALGTGTTANGQDQFVFGRNNVADTTNAEIVGGGIPAYIVRGGEKIQNKVFIKLGTAYTVQEAKDLNAACTSPYKCPDNFFNGQLPQGFDFSKGVDVLVATEQIDLGCTLIYSHDSSLYPNRGKGIIKLDASHMDIRNIVVLDETSIKSNIRTLDFSGNETLAGKLTAGNLETSGTVKIGATSLSEAQLISLLALLNPSE